MSNRRFRLPSPAFVIAMIALFAALGGTSFAATRVISSPGDKKADTKLIKKLAPTLSVKHASSANSATNATNATNATHATSATSATNATNATLLGGKTAASLETSAYTFKLPAVSGINRQLFNLPGLPAGIYYASYSLASTVDTSGQEVGCYFTNNGDTGNIQLLSYGVQSVFGAFVSTSGSGIVDTRTHAVQLVCFDSSGNFALDTTDETPSVSFVAVDNLSTASSTAAARRTTSSRTIPASAAGK